MGTKIGGEGQFDILKKMGCVPNPKIPPEAIFRQWGFRKLSATLRRDRDEHSKPKKRCLLKNSPGYANSDKNC